MKRTQSAKQLKSPNQLTARELVHRLSSVRRLIQEVDHRGGIVRLMDDARLSEARQRALTKKLEHGWKGFRAYVIRIGDDRRAKGQAVSLCSLPGDPSCPTPTTT